MAWDLVCDRDDMTDTILVGGRTPAPGDGEVVLRVRV
jgi:hypothetical protein